jgi:hypothetical protein
LVTRDRGFGCWFGDLPTDQLQVDARIVFTFLWQEGWVWKDFQVEIAAPNQTQKNGMNKTNRLPGRINRKI